MCGIIGIFNHPHAFEQARTGLALLQNRGKDGFGIANLQEIQHHHDLNKFYPLKEKNVVGHALHSIVEYVPQPLKGKGLLAANCEIYNWEKLNIKYGWKVKNDTELLLSFLDHKGSEKLEELDGVYAWAYWRDNRVILARDLLGEKPLWFAHTIDSFAFASEKKVLEKLGYLDIQELNPRQILHYDIAGNSFTTTQRPFFTFLPEHHEPYAVIKEKTAHLLEQAMEKRIPRRKFGLLFSGGIDSTYLAHYFRAKGYDFICYTAVLDTAGTPPADLLSAQKVAAVLGLKLKIRKIKLQEIPQYLKKIVPLIEDSNVVKVGVALTFYLAGELAKQDGCKVIFSGLGSEEIFAGYERHKQSGNINQECVSGLLKMYERDLYRDDVITMHHGLELRLPFLDKELVQYALKIPGKYKLKGEMGKFILRDLAHDQGILEEVAFHKKIAAQYGSKLDWALEKLAKNNKFPSKSAYVRTFYPTHNLKLGVLFSGGKDSTYAAYIMKKQNYELACLITVKSANQDSYMFHTPAIEMTELQAEAMALPIVVQETTGEKEKELVDLEKAVKLAKKKYNLDGLVSGALFSTYQRDRIEKIADKLGLKIFAPLWHKPQEEELRELIQQRFEVIITSISAEGLDESWLGRKIDGDVIAAMVRLNRKIGINVAFEGGEAESLVLDCPLFRKKIGVVDAEKVMESKNTGRLIIKRAILKLK